MMFSGIFTSRGSAVRNTAVLGLVLLLVGNYLDLIGYHFFPIDTHKMLFFDSFGLLANTVIFGSTLIYVLLSGRDIEKIAQRMPVAECFALVFFVLCGVTLVTTFNTLLMLFLGLGWK